MFKSLHFLFLPSYLFVVLAHSSLLTLESTETLEIKTSMLFNFAFANDTISLRFFFFLLTIDLFFSIPAVIAQVFNPIAELVITIGIPKKKQKQKLKQIQQSQKLKQESFQHNLELYIPFCAFHSSIHFALLIQQNNYLFLLFILL